MSTAITIQGYASSPRTLSVWRLRRTDWSKLCTVLSRRSSGLYSGILNSHIKLARRAERFFLLLSELADNIIRYITKRTVSLLAILFLIYPLFALTIVFVKTSIVVLPFMMRPAGSCESYQHCSTILFLCQDGLAHLDRETRAITPADGRRSR